MAHNVTNVTVNSSTGTVSFQGSHSYRGVTVTPLTPSTGLQRPLPTTSALVISKVLLKAMNREKKGDFKMFTIRNIKPSEILCVASLTGLIR